MQTRVTDPKSFESRNTSTRNIFSRHTVQITQYKQM